MFTSEDIAAKVKEVVVDHLAILIDDYSEKGNLSEDFGADELDLFEMGFLLEDYFEVDITSADLLDTIERPSDYITFIEQQLRIKEKNNEC